MGKQRKGVENLIPMNKRTKEEVREIARKGGISSGVSRRQKKTVKELVNDVFYMGLSKEEEKLIKKYFPEAQSEDMNRGLQIVIGLFRKARQGDVKAFKMIIDVLGQGFASKLEINDKRGKKEVLVVTEAVSDEIKQHIEEVTGLVVDNGTKEA